MSATRDAAVDEFVAAIDTTDRDRIDAAHARLVELRMLPSTDGRPPAPAEPADSGPGGRCQMCRSQTVKGCPGDPSYTYCPRCDRQPLKETDQ